MPPSRPLAERFWEKVDRCGFDECWVWTHYCDENGYGRIGGPGSKILGAHRVSYELHKGPIPVGLKVRHTCDNPPCVNPAHLLCGTDQDNSNDMVGRSRQNSCRGEKHGSAKLSKGQVAEIRRDYVKGSRISGQCALARKYEVCQAQIWRIVNEKVWK